MNLIESIKEKTEWEAFYSERASSEFESKSFLKSLRKFIDTNKFIDIYNDINSKHFFYSYPIKQEIAKPNGKKRVVYCYRSNKTYALKFLAFKLKQYDYLFADNLFSFRSSIGSFNAIRKIKDIKNLNQCYAYKVDISSYFNSIDQNDLFKVLECSEIDKSFIEFTKNLLSLRKFRSNKAVIEEYPGIMPGMPISPFLSNYYLKELDEHFVGKNYFRYADDILVISDNKQEVEEMAKYIKEFLIKKGLNVNPSKETYYNQEPFEFLGFLIDGKKVNIAKSTLEKAKKDIKRRSNGIRVWGETKGFESDKMLRALFKYYDRKFFSNESGDLCWTKWYFPTINTPESLKELDNYIQQEARSMCCGGKHTKKNYKNIKYNDLVRNGYISLYNRYYKFKSRRDA